MYKNIHIFFWSFKEAKTGLIRSFQRYMGVWALKMTQLAHYPNFYVKYRTALEVTGVLFISSEKRTRGGSLSYNKTKLFIGRADPLSFWASLDGWWIYFTKCSHSEISWDKPPHALSERGMVQTERCQWPPCSTPQQCGGARFSDSPSKNSRRGWDPWVGWGVCHVGQWKASDPIIFLAPSSVMCVISSLKLLYICVFILHLFVCTVCAGICAHIWHHV